MKCSGTVFVITFIIASNCCAAELYLVTRAANTTTEHILIPHAGCVAKYDDGTFEWVHFGIKDVNRDLKKAVLRRWVNGDVRTNEFPVNHLVGFTVDENKLRTAVNEIKKEFNGADYKWGVRGRDCVTFATTLCKKIGLRAQDDFGLPWVAFMAIYNRNTDRIGTCPVLNVDNKPGYMLPWE